MLKSFNSLLIDKVQCVSSENIFPEFFFQPTVRACIFFGTMVLCKNFFFMHMHLQDIFFQNHPPPPPPQKSNGRPLSHSNLLLHCADEPQKRRNSFPQLYLNFRFGLYHATVVLLFLRSCQPLLLIVLFIFG